MRALMSLLAKSSAWLHKLHSLDEVEVCGLDGES